MLESLINAANVTVEFKVWEIVMMIITVIGLVGGFKAYLNGYFDEVEE